MTTLHLRTINKLYRMADFKNIKVYGECSVYKKSSFALCVNETSCITKNIFEHKLINKYFFLISEETTIHMAIGDPHFIFRQMFEMALDNNFNYIG